MTAHDQYDELVAGYALGALDVADQQAFEAHLPTCPECQALVADLVRVSAGIGMATDPVEPPASLRARTLHRATGQLPATATVAAFRQPAASSVGSWWRLAAAAALLVVVGLTAYSVVLNRNLSEAERVIAELSVREAGLRTQLADARASSARLSNTLNVLRSGDMVRVDLKGAGSAPQAVGRAFVSASRGLIFNADSLPRLEADRQYQLWVIPAGPGAAPVSAGVFDVDPTGASTLAMPLPSGVTTVAVVAVTEEPAGGSLRATTAPLLVGTVSNN